MHITVREGFVNHPGMISIYDIKLEPKTYEICIRTGIGDRLEIPIGAIRDRAAEGLAKLLVNRLTYESYLDPSTASDIHTFSVRDCTIKERELVKQKLLALQKDLVSANIRIETLQKYEILYHYNSRHFLLKFKDWLLYDKPFTKKDQI